MLFVLVVVALIVSCSDDAIDSADTYLPTPLTLQVPTVFSERILPPILPVNNPLTVEGVALGEKLFFDRSLSGDGTVSCASCHISTSAFTDSDQFSIGINGNRGTRNSMPLFNLAWNYGERFFWDGAAFSLEDQAFEPVTNPNEMGNSWPQLVATLEQDSEYPELFRMAFGEAGIDSVKVVRAIAQFERTLISSNSRFDRFLLGELELTPQEENGLNVFLMESKGDCFHCHGNPNNPLWTDNIFHNNGLDATFTDLGLGGVTGDPADNGKFKTPSLRNLAFTAPYMHDGRFQTLDEVIDHYSEGLQDSPTIDPLMKSVAQGGVQLSEQDKADLKAFLLSLSDENFVGNN